MKGAEFRALERCRVEAATVCAEYERWAAEITRLTAAIAEEFCPKENVREDEWENVIRSGTSCFTNAKADLCQGDFGEAEYPNQPITLAQIEETVTDCPSCTRLVGFIRARKEAKKQYGIAKRRVRHVGKKVAAALKAVGEIE